MRPAVRSPRLRVFAASPWPGRAQHPIRVGASLSLTGAQYSVQGNYGREGYLLCQKHANGDFAVGMRGRPALSGRGIVRYSRGTSLIHQEAIR